MTRSLLLTLALLALSVSAQVDLEEPFPGALEACYDTYVDDDTDDGYTQGFCEHYDCCAYDYYVTEPDNLCPDYPGTVRYFVARCNKIMNIFEYFSSNPSLVNFNR